MLSYLYFGMAEKLKGLEKIALSKLEFRPGDIVDCYLGYGFTSIFRRGMVRRAFVSFEGVQYEVVVEGEDRVFSERHLQKVVDKPPIEIEKPHQFKTKKKAKKRAKNTVRSKV
tara:strand:+ start:20113 stop:20451 length:339 start_codon:yes stop_codon:yes gene_type:complete